MEAPDFAGYATKAGLKCSDGRTITAKAFEHMDGVQVPLVWMHGHNNPENVLGHVLLQARDDGMYCQGFFNGTPTAQHIKAAVHNKDITALSIWANDLKEQAKRVLHGMIREVSLVLSGANRGALIDQVFIKHSDGDEELIDGEAIIYTGLELELEHAAGDAAPDEETVQDVYNTLSDKQKSVVHFMLATALEGASVSHSNTDTEPDTETEPETEGTGSEEDNTDGAGTEEDKTAEGDLAHNEEGTTDVSHRNVFDRSAETDTKKRVFVSKEDLESIRHDAMRPGQTLRGAVQSYALAHGITDIDTLFPDPKMVTDRPEWDKRRTEWVAGVINGTHKTPFTRIKSIVADLTFEDARAKGYVKGSLKKEQFFGLVSRVTTPTTIYKKQKLDRDDIIDITDFDVVAWLKQEMRFMLEEEIARAILIGDGRAVDDEDKIKDPVGATEGAGVRSILNDDDLYVSTLYVNIDDANSSYEEVIDAVIRGRRLYKGTGMPVFFTTEIVISNLLLIRDTQGRRLYPTMNDLMVALRVSAIIPVEVMEDETDVIGIMVNLSDYAVGADKGGEISLFDDFDIDYNQYKYLIETRISGALIKIRAAQVVRKVASGAALVVPVSPVQDEDEVTVVTTTGVTHKVGAFTGTVTYNGSPVTVGATVTASFPIILSDGASVTVTATPASGSYYFGSNVEDEWTFTYTA